MLCMPLKHIQCISASITPALVELLAVRAGQLLGKLLQNRGKGSK
jgi:hypothetical protein